MLIPPMTRARMPAERIILQKARPNDPLIECPWQWRLPKTSTPSIVIRMARVMNPDFLPRRGQFRSKYRGKMGTSETMRNAI